MFEVPFTRIRFLYLLLIALALSPRCQAQNMTILSSLLSPLPNGSYNLFIVAEQLIGPNGSYPLTNVYAGPLLSITNRGTNVPFQTVLSGPPLSIYTFNFLPPLDCVGETFTLFDGNASTNLNVVLAPVFLAEPQSQSLFVGDNASLTAQAAHFTGYQWQQNGTNLIEDGHFSGVTNSTLQIKNLSADDAGIYTVVAWHPTQPATSTNAVLAVFKPIQLSFARTAPPGFVRLIAGNADQSPFEAGRISKLDFYSTADLSLSFTNWVLSTNSVWLTNGVLQSDFAADGIAAGFWRVAERP
jgi:hypothetical protein